MTRTQSLYIQGLIIALLVPIFLVAFSVIGPTQPTAAANSACPPLIAKGSAGSDVRDLQTKLNAEGITDSNGNALAVDGDFGWRTESAVKKLQSSWGLSVDGIVGNQTWGVLGRCEGVLVV